MTAQQEYRRLMDKIVDRAKGSVTVTRIRNHGHGEHPLAGQEVTLRGAAAKRRDLVLSLSPDQRETLCDILLEERRGAFHDILALLEDEIALDELQLVKHGSDVGAVREESLHYDFVCRLEGDDWPGED